PIKVKVLRDHWHTARFLPDQLEAEITLEPQTRHRSLYQVTLYTATVQVRGVFGDLNPQKLGAPEKNILWNLAHVTLAISGNRTIKEISSLSWDQTDLTFEPPTKPQALFASRLEAPLPKIAEAKASQKGPEGAKPGQPMRHEFSFTLTLAGSRSFKIA